MAFFLKAKKLNFSSGSYPIVVLNEEDALGFGIRPGDRIELNWRRKKTVVVVNVNK